MRFAGFSFLFGTLIRFCVLSALKRKITICATKIWRYQKKSVILQRKILQLWKQRNLKSN